MLGFGSEKTKVVNDPVYGFIKLDHELPLCIVEHPAFQRLRRISQMGVAFLAYPGATHNRFHHSLGTYSLMRMAIKELLQKHPNVLSTNEVQAALCAALLHDIGHGPFSHGLEKQFIPLSHESISLHIMRNLSKSLGGALEEAIAIYEGKHPKKFLCSLLYGQLDVDRMDYLARDCFYTGVVEGRVGYDRIIKMIDLDGGRLVVEEKGLSSVENFLLSRLFMYQQVYHHKTVVCVEQMLIRAISRAKELFQEKSLLPSQVTTPLAHFLSRNDQEAVKPVDIAYFLELDDSDIWQLIKEGAKHKDTILSTLCKGIKNRQLFKVKVNSEPIKEKEIMQKRKEIQSQMGCLTEQEVTMLAFGKKKKVDVYQENKQEAIYIKKKSGEIAQLGELSLIMTTRLPITVSKYYFCYLSKALK